MTPFLLAALSWSALVAAKHAVVPLAPRAVTSLDEAATAEAQQRDGTATRAFSGVAITTTDGRCLFVDKLSGDFRENLTPIQVADCGSTDGQGWDVITAGKHNDAANSMLIVSTLTQACFNFDPRRAAGNQVLLFSCGGRADGGGQATNSQLFPFNGTAGPLSFEPENAPGSCITVKGDVLDIAACNSADKSQYFIFGSAAAAPPASSSSTAASSASSASSSASAISAVSATSAASSAAATTSTLAATSSITSPPAIQTEPASCSSRRTRTVLMTVTSSRGASSSAAASSGGIALGAAVPSSADLGSQVTGTISAIDIPESAVPVSRGGSFNPTAAAEANAVDTTATRNLTSVTIRAPNGQCLFVDPTAGDFRENLIPISLVDCSGTSNERWDIVTAGKHNNVPGTALIVSSLINGCISFDGRRAEGDTVNLFSCGGRADGTGDTNADQLMPFIGAFSFAFAPSGEKGSVCILPGDDGRLVSGDCPTNGAELFAVFP